MSYHFGLCTGFVFDRLNYPYSRIKSYLVVVYSLLNVLCDSNYYYFVEKFGVTLHPCHQAVLFWQQGNANFTE